MPRRARIDAPGALQHIIVRGIERRNIFNDDKDRNNVVERLAEILIDTETFCFAWALIPNHVHLLLRTGKTPLATVMRRLLTGYAVSYKRRHGHLFQNRYKFILCQEEPYFLELVRNIHLNAMQAKTAKHMKALLRHPCTCHSALMGRVPRDFQNTGYVLRLFGKRLADARKGYRTYVKKGIHQGRRPDLVGGGLIRSAGGWSAAKAMGATQLRMKGDERILGDGDFVQSVLQAAKEQYEEKYRLKAHGYNWSKVVRYVSTLLEIKPEQLLAPG